MKKIIIIAAIGANKELGYDNGLIWRIKEDLAFFKRKTEYHTIVMGRKTFESLPGMLSNRRHIVITSTINDLGSEVIVCNDLESLLALLETIDDEIYIIGGSSIYRLFIDKADEMILTEIEDEFSRADAYFPDFNLDDWNVETVGEFSDEKTKYLRKVYSRK